MRRTNRDHPAIRERKSPNPAEIYLDCSRTFLYHAFAMRKTNRQGASKRRLTPQEKIVRRIERWHKILAPQFPDIDPHDLDLIIAAQLRSPKERMQIMFLKRRKDGRYVF